MVHDKDTLTPSMKYQSIGVEVMMWFSAANRRDWLQEAQGFQDQRISRENRAIGTRAQEASNTVCLIGINKGLMHA